MMSPGPGTGPRNNAPGANAAESEAPPSRFIALIFDEAGQAEEAWAVLDRMADDERLSEKDEFAVVWRADRAVCVLRDADTLRAGERTDRLVGLIVAVLADTAPCVPADAELVCKLTDRALIGRFIRDVAFELEENRSALLLLTRSSHRRRQKALERLRPFLPTILQIDLPADLEQELGKDLARALCDDAGIGCAADETCESDHE